MGFVPKPARKISDFAQWFGIPHRQDFLLCKKSSWCWETRDLFVLELAVATGFEPAVFALTERRVNQATPRDHICAYPSKLLSASQWDDKIGCIVIRNS